MRLHLTKVERMAAAAVLSMSAGVAAAGIALLRRHAKYLAERAASTFGEEDELDPLVWPEEAVWESVDGQEENAQEPVDGMEIVSDNVVPEG